MYGLHRILGSRSDALHREKLREFLEVNDVKQHRAVNMESNDFIALFNWQVKKER